MLIIRSVLFTELHLYPSVRSRAELIINNASYANTNPAAGDLQSKSTRRAISPVIHRTFDRLACPLCFTYTCPMTVLRMSSQPSQECCIKLLPILHILKHLRLLTTAITESCRGKGTQTAPKQQLLRGCYNNGL